MPVLSASKVTAGTARLLPHLDFSPILGYFLIVKLFFVRIADDPR
jgi:hypothetical protein